MSAPSTGFAARLRELRERRHLSRRVLAELCGMSHAQVSRYERGERQPKADDLVALADFFEVSADDLLGRFLNKT